jgi:hypothetical protein
MMSKYHVNREEKQNQQKKKKKLVSQNLNDEFLFFSKAIQHFSHEKIELVEPLTRGKKKYSQID